MTQVNLQKSIVSNIKKLAKSETVTKELLSGLSRDCLTYIGLNHSTDIATVNRLIGVLTPMNRKTAVLFFNYFLPFKLDHETDTFGSMVKGEKILAAYQEKVVEFMATDENDIWSWASENVEIEAKPKDFAVKVAALVKRALADENEAINASEVMTAVMAGGVSLKDLWALIGGIQKATATPETIEETPVTDMETLVHGGLIDEGRETVAA